MKLNHFFYCLAFVLLYITCTSEDPVQPEQSEEPIEQEKEDTIQDITPPYLIDATSKIVTRKIRPGVVPLYYSPKFVIKYPIDSIFEITIDDNNHQVKITIDTAILTMQDTDIPISKTSIIEDTLIFYRDDYLDFDLNSIENIADANLHVKFKWWIKEDSTTWNPALKDSSILAEEVYDLNYKIDKAIIGDHIISEENLSSNTWTNFYIENDINIAICQQLDQEIDLTPYYSIKYHLENVELFHNNEMIDGNSTVENNVIEFSPSNLLESSTDYLIKYSFIKEIYNGSNWVAKSKQYEITINTTPAEFSKIDQLIEYQYPCWRQYHFLPNEYRYGYIKFKQDFDELNIDEINTTSVLKIKLTDYITDDSKYIETLFIKDSLYLQYELPSDFIDNERVYKLELFKQDIDNEALSLIYENFFRTSMFNTFAEKFESFNLGEEWDGSISTDRHKEFYNFLYPEEYFDDAEIKTIPVDEEVNIINGLIKITNNYSIGDFITDLAPIYDKYFDNPDLLKWRDTSFFGVPPVHTTEIYQTNNEIFLTNEYIENGAPPIEKQQSCIMKNWVEYFTYFDCIDLYSINNMDYSAIQAENESFGINLCYVLPGLNTVTFKGEKIITVDFR